MVRAVADTHTVIWYLYADGRLSANARNAIERAAASLTLGVPVISRDSKIRLSSVATIW